MIALLGWAWSLVGLVVDSSDWIAGGIGVVSLVGAFWKRWRVHALALAAIVAVVYVATLHIRIADLRLDLARQAAAIEKRNADAADEVAKANAKAVADLNRRHADELRSLERRRLALDQALSQRDKILDEVRRAKTAHDPLPDAFDAFLDRVR